MRTYNRIPHKASIVAFLVSLAAMGAFFFGCQSPVKPRPGMVEGKEPIIRAMIFGPAASMPLSVNGPLKVQSRGRVVYQSSSMVLAEVRAEGNVLCLGAQRLAVNGVCDVIPDINGTLCVNGQYYRGSLRLHITGGQIYAVNHVQIEDYLKGVIPGEMPKRFSVEAYKAQAVSARTFALYEKYTAPGSKTWDVLANEGSQMYLGKSVEIAKGNQAVDATRGVVLVSTTEKYGRKIFPTYFSSTCGGWTQPAVHLANIDPNISPLRGGVKCDGCVISPHRNWDQKVVPLADVVQKINEKGASPAPFQQLTAVNVLSRTPQGHIVRVEVVDITGQRVTISAQRFRLIVGSRKMPSTFCDISIQGSNLVFSNGHGLGHACGMCQWGAEGMAQKGYTAKEILLHYYPTAALVKAY
ncbi:MAG: SpoIID/LytB domain-containing protein [Phycisphaerae bacterium]|jgi:stage II sporulation protein D|nr:SpoIID/LytB domain-containing protein [Phycisphaerae bacterium]